MERGIWSLAIEMLWLLVVLLLETAWKKLWIFYGRPDFIDFNNRWFYGHLRYNSDNIVGIFFEHNGSKVTKIIISEN